jgi:hypothetical protein
VARNAKLSNSLRGNKNAAGPRGASSSNPAANKGFGTGTLSGMLSPVGAFGVGMYGGMTKSKTGTRKQSAAGVFSGAVSGAVSGALVGGPVGMVLGAPLGAAGTYVSQKVGHIAGRRLKSSLKK